MLDILVTLAFGGAVGALFYKIKVPGGMMIGAMCGAFLLSMTLHMGSMPYAAKFTAQIVAGTFLGSSVDKSDLVKLKKCYKSVLVVILGYLVLNLLAGALLYSVGSIDLLTALLCAVPGGMSDTPLVAGDMGADISAVVVAQFVRLCVGIGIFPSWITWMDRKNQKSTVLGQEPTKPRRKQRDISVWPIIITFSIAAATGALGRWLKIPAGALLFSAISVLLVKILLFPTLLLPRGIKRGAQVLSGTYIGCSISYEAILRIPMLVFPLLCLIVAYMAFAFLMGKLLNKKFAIPFKEAMLMVTPAGASDMALISADMGVQSSVLSVTHVARLVVATSLFPQICYFFAKLF